MRSAPLVPSLALAALSLLPLAACSGAGDEEHWPEPTWPELRSELPHDAEPTLDPDEEDALAIDGRAFALDLYHQLRSENTGNLLFSPYSIRVALAMPFGGAGGDGRAEMAEVLHYSLPDERQHVAFNWLDDELASRARPNILGSDGSVETGEVLVQQANAVWVEQSLQDEIRTPWLDLLSQHYDAGLRLANFSGNKEAEIAKINQWVEARTRGLIPELITAVPDVLTMVLVNTLYLKAPWDTRFDGPTNPASFTSGDQIFDVPMMLQEGLYAEYGVGDDYEIVAVPLRGGALEMIALMPTGDFASYEAALDEETLAAALDSLQPNYVDLAFPKLDIHGRFELAQTLSTMGMPLPFIGGAFPDIGGVNAIYAVTHEAKLQADEDGVVATAATAVLFDDEVGGGSSGFEIRVDRAFFLMVRDAPSDNLLFFGRVLDPRG